jgi:hypothetical protein
MRCRTQAMEATRRRSAGSLTLIALSAVVSLVGIGCQDKCTDVQCAPAPTPLEVIVVDTLTVDTVFVVINGIDTVRTNGTVEVTRSTTDAIVTLNRVERERPLVPFDTLKTRDGIFYESDTTRLPETTFWIKVERGGRGDSTKQAQLTHVTGCCGYPIVGRFQITLPRN